MGSNNNINANSADQVKVQEQCVRELVNNLKKNKYPIICVRCSSRILNPEVANYKEIEFSLPRMTQHKNKEDVDKDILKQYWLVNDKFSFENVGFTNTVSGLKYLTCADCEIGPIGWHNPNDNLCYVALDRISYLR